MNKAREAVLKIQETEQEMRKNRCNTRLPEDTTQEKKNAPQKPQPVAPPKTTVPPSGTEIAALSAHEQCIHDESSYLILRLESIHNYAVMIISDVKKLARVLNEKITETIEKNYQMEEASATTLMDYIHAQIENEEGIPQAIMFNENRFQLSVDQFVRTIPKDMTMMPSQLDRMTLYGELSKMFPDCNDIIYEDLQRIIVYVVERSYGSDLVDRGWQLMDSDELIAATLVNLRMDKVPDGVNVCDVQVNWKSVLKVLANPPPLELLKNR